MYFVNIEGHHWITSRIQHVCMCVCCCMNKSVDFVSIVVESMRLAISRSSAAIADALHVICKALHELRLSQGKKLGEEIEDSTSSKLRRPAASHRALTVSRGEHIVPPL